MKFFKWQTRTILLLTTVLSCGVALFLVYLHARRVNNAALLSRFFLAAVVLSAPLIASVAAWPRLSEAFGSLGNSFVASLLKKLSWRRRSRSQQRAEHRRELNRQVIEFLARHPTLPARGFLDRKD